MAIFNNTSFRLLEQGLDGVWQKQQVISQNIANADTPGYKAKTVNFKTVLTEETNNIKDKAMSKSKPQLNLATTVSVEKGTNQTFDENNVDTEKEHIALADAQIQYNLLVNKISNEFDMIKSAIMR